MSIALGVNIDHVATLRQARRAQTPRPQDAAAACLKSGADYIVVHLRQDERHINSKDVAALCKKFPGKIHLEISTVLAEKALTHKPFSVCIVPENPGEVTTTGGLRFTPAIKKRLFELIEQLHKKKILVSLFVSPIKEDIHTAAKLGADMVELCTRDYSEASSCAAQRRQLRQLAEAAYWAQSLGLEVHAGHGLDYQNVEAVCKIDGMACMNIGFSIITRALFAGLNTAVREMKALL